MTKDSNNNNTKYTKYNLPSLKEARMRRGKVINFNTFELDPKYLNLGNEKKFLLKTYGCQGNLADSEKIVGLLNKMGFTQTNAESSADFILFNTCAIRENAEDRVYGEIGRVQKYKRQKPDLIIGVCGCMPQEEKTIINLKKRFPQLNIIFGTHNISSLPEYLYDAIVEEKKVIEVLSIEGNIVEGLPVIRDHPKKAWVNIMYGCDEFCTYCIVPYTRGRERSRLPEDILAEINQLSKDGYVEVTLLGQNVNAYGKDLHDRNYSFADLLKDINNLSIQRVRFTTSHPRDLDIPTIEAMSLGGNIMPHLHLPVQSGSDEVLQKMNRKYTHTEYLNKISILKSKVPGISITTDIIVAFPGETHEQFLETLNLVREVEFEGAFTFIFSPREGTPAAKYINELDNETKHKRLYQLNELINHYSLKGNERFEGKVVKVLVEGPSKNNPNIMTGYTPHNKLVNFVGENKNIGDIVDVKIVKAFTWHLLGEIDKKRN